MGGEPHRSYDHGMMDRVITHARRLSVRWSVFATREHGASMVEYALLVALIAIVALVAVAFLGTSLDSTYDDIGSSLVDAGA